ncbi:MAG: amidinotransferase [Magnetospirillum sp.]|nr:amidinotransferase [Magnetospirillum sp.]
MTMHAGRVVMASPDHYEVCYAINPWMKPEQWGADRDGPARAKAQWQALAGLLGEAGLTVEVVPAVPGLPDLVFPANAAVVLDGRVLLARFRYPQRQGEERWFRDFFEGLGARGLVAAVESLPDGVFQEGAGDCLWDASRQLFWAAHGPRSTADSPGHIRRVFGQTVVDLELVTARFYHLDTCFCVLSGGEVLYFPPALSARAQEAVIAHVPAELRLVATADEAEAFSLNAINIGRDLIMTAPPPRLRAVLEERGYRCRPVDLSSFVLSGGASYCMTLRLDRFSHASRRVAAE